MSQKADNSQRLPFKRKYSVQSENEKKDFSVLAPISLRGMKFPRDHEFLKKLRVNCDEISVNKSQYQKESQINKMKMLQIYQLSFINAMNDHQKCSVQLKQKKAAIKSRKSRVQARRQEQVLQNIRQSASGSNNEGSNKVNQPTIIYVPLPYYANYYSPQNQSNLALLNQNIMQQYIIQKRLSALPQPQQIFHNYRQPKSTQNIIISDVLKYFDEFQCDNEMKREEEKNENDILQDIDKFQYDPEKVDLKKQTKNDHLEGNRNKDFDSCRLIDSIKLIKQQIKNYGGDKKKNNNSLKESLSNLAKGQDCSNQQTALLSRLVCVLESMLEIQRQRIKDPVIQKKPNNTDQVDRLSPNKYFQSKIKIDQGDQDQNENSCLKQRLQNQPQFHKRNNVSKYVQLHKGTFTVSTLQDQTIKQSGYSTNPSQLIRPMISSTMQIDRHKLLLQTQIINVLDLIIEDFDDNILQKASIARPSKNRISSIQKSTIIRRISFQTQKLQKQVQKKQYTPVKKSTKQMERKNSFSIKTKAVIKNSQTIDWQKPSQLVFEKRNLQRSGNCKEPKLTGKESFYESNGSSIDAKVSKNSDYFSARELPDLMFSTKMSNQGRKSSKRPASGLQKRRSNG